MKANYISTKVIELGSCAFRQWRASHSHCHLVHGYQLKAKFWFGCSQLDDKNWAVDFGGLKQLKAQLQDTFDHTMCVAADDPCLDLFKQLADRDAVKLVIFDKGVGIERTAEFCFNAASQYLKEHYGDRCWVEKVEVFEHQDNSAVYNPTAIESQPAPVQGIVNEQEVKQAEQQAQAVQQNAPTPAPVGNAVTSGKGNWFAGTTWG